MKKIYILALLIMGVMMQQKAFAQNWNHDRAGIYSIGLGGAQVIGVSRYGSSIANIGMSINASGEYRVHDWIGVGWQTGIIFAWGYGYGYGYYYGGGRPAIGIPIGVKANFHILDCVGVDIAEDLDVYAGLNFGGGPSFSTYRGGGVGGFIHVGPQVGARYWFNDKVAIFGEFGYGATFANAGVTF